MASQDSPDLESSAERPTWYEVLLDHLQDTCRGLSDLAVAQQQLIKSLTHQLEGKEVFHPLNFPKDGPEPTCTVAEHARVHFTPASIPIPVSKITCFL